MLKIKTTLFFFLFADSISLWEKRLSNKIFKRNVSPFTLCGHIHSFAGDVLNLHFPSKDGKESTKWRSQAQPSFVRNVAEFPSQ